MSPNLFIRALLTGAFLVSAAPAQTAKPIDFNRDIRPILSDHCFACHGPDEKARMVNLRLDIREGAFAAKGEARYIVPGNAAASLLYQRVSHAKPVLRMPPASTGRTLTEQQVSLIRRWINEGAAWETHWSYLPPSRPALPAVSNRAWPRNPIDHFVLARLEKEGLKPSPETDKTTLLRRVTLDLTGLPPAPADLAAFLTDRSPNAYERVVDRLLNSPHYGERMAMQWLDLARYADTHGYHIDSHRDMWPWRDWVIRAYNDNKPFDQFTLEQLAGDLLPAPTREQRVATGFNRNHMINFEGGAIPEEYLAEYVVDRVEATSTIWMGMTMGCARCHDHKYDPISQRDFYRLFAFFNTVAEKGLDGRRGNAEPLIPVAPQGQIMELDALECAIREKRDAMDEKQIDAALAAWEKTLRRPFAAPVTDGIAAHFPFDGNLHDVSGSYLHGRPIDGEPGFPGGIIDKALSLTADDHVRLAPRLPVDTSKPFTVALWIRPSSDKAEVIEIFQGALELSTEPSYYMPELKRVARLRFQGFQTQEPIVIGQWTHVAFTRESGAYGLFLHGEPAKLELFEKPIEPSVETALEIKGYRGSLDDVRIYSRAITAAEARTIALHHPAAALLEIPAAKRDKDQKPRLREYFLTHAAPEPLRTQHAELKALEKRKEQMERAVPTVMVMQEMGKPRETHMLGRGDYRNKGEKVTAGVPSTLPPLPPGAPSNRLGLAQWLLDPANPLTARVTVNRYWQMYFGHGLVKTSEDLGSQGEAPSHPELLDWLATEFVRLKWDVKAMQRLIVTSATYRQSSKVTPALLERDPENRLLARMSRFRLSAEFIRDNALAASGLLKPAIGGPSVFPYQPPGLWEEMAFHGIYSAQTYTPGKGEDLYRRGMYTFWKRTVPPASLATFDAPDREKCTARRAITNTPLQALILMNDPTYVEAARHLAQRALREAGRDASRRIEHIFRQVTLRKPTTREVAILRDLERLQLAAHTANTENSRALLANGESAADKSLLPSELAAWTNIAAVVLSLDEAITKE
ncbi:MAG: DUF1553 domain-containing protein [Acidimicrobiia bacterium]|nr:DUF1553 domain-containing protein [Acidimicrobiia bacterium]